MTHHNSFIRSLFLSFLTMSYPYACEIELNFPTPSQAEKTLRVMEVDAELSDQVLRTFALVGHRCVTVYVCVERNCVATCRPISFVS